jgi:hypothetical protein
LRARLDRWLWGAVPAAVLGLAVANLPAWRFEATLAPKVEAALKTVSGADGGRWARVEASGRDLAVSGEAPSPEARRAVLVALESVRGVRRVVDRTAVASVAAPFNWSASRDGDRILLSGAAPSGPVRDALLRQAGTVAPGLRVEDRAATAGDEPARFPEAGTLALRLLERLSPGTVTVADGTISVEGVAPSSDDFEAATAALRALPPGYRLAATAILPPVVAPYTWSARRSGDALAVAGYAPSLASRERVAAAARRLPASRLLLDLRVARGLRPGLDYDAATDLLLAQLGRMGDGEVSLQDDVLRVTGATPDKDGAARVSAALESETPPGFRLGGIQLSAVRPQPYRFEARRAPGRLLLAGHLPDEAARDGVRALVRKRFFTEAVDDQLRLADGAPAGFAAGASAGLEQLSRLAEGEAALRETALVLSGETLYEQTAERMPADLRAALPPGFTARPTSGSAGTDRSAKAPRRDRRRAAPLAAARRAPPRRPPGRLVHAAAAPSRGWAEPRREDWVSRGCWPPRRDRAGRRGASARHRARSVLVYLAGCGSACFSVSSYPPARTGRRARMIDARGRTRGPQAVGPGGCFGAFGARSACSSHLSERGKSPDRDQVVVQQHGA